jgi:hypothetical protein
VPADVGSPLAPRLAPQDFADLATLTSSQEGNAKGRTGGEPACILLKGLRGWIGRAAVG